MIRSDVTNFVIMEKARSHKYIRRLGMPKHYTYVYEEPGTYEPKKIEAVEPKIKPEISTSGEQVTEKIEERREGKVRATYGMNAVRAWSMLAKNKYPNSPYLGDVGVRECMQNSLDAVTEALENGQIKRGKISIELLPNGDGFTFKDNGIGMSDVDINDKFLSLYSTGKDVQGRFGGFGIAKAVILAPTEDAHWEIRTRDNSFNDQMASRNDIVGTALKLQGTEIKVYSSDTILSRTAKQYVETTEVPKGITVQFGEVPEGPGFLSGLKLVNPFLKWKHETQYFNAGVNTKVTMSFFPKPSSEYNRKLIIRLADKKTGAKLTQAINDIYGSFKGAVVVDIETTSTPGSDDYPLTDSRMGFKWGKVEDFVSSEINKRSREKKSAERVGVAERWMAVRNIPSWRNTVERAPSNPGYKYLQETINKIWDVELPKHVEGLGRPYTPLDTLELIRDTGYKGSEGCTIDQAKLLMAFETLAHLYSTKLADEKLPCPIREFHVLLSKPTSTGVRMAHFDRARRALGLDIKTFPKEAFATPASLALEMVNTIQHEFAHNWAHEHDEDFTTWVGTIQTRTASLFNTALEISGAMLGKEVHVTIDTPQGLEKFKKTPAVKVEYPKASEWRAKLVTVVEDISNARLTPWSVKLAIEQIANEYNIPEGHVMRVLNGYRANKTRKEKSDAIKRITESSIEQPSIEKGRHPSFVVNLGNRFPIESGGRSQWADSRFHAETGTGRLGLEGRSGGRRLLVTEPFLKARPHKYIKRIGMSGQYQYVYRKSPERQAQLATVHSAIQDGRAYLDTAFGKYKVAVYNDDTGWATSYPAHLEPSKQVQSSYDIASTRRNFMVTLDDIIIEPKGFEADHQDHLYVVKEPSGQYGSEKYTALGYAKDPKATVKVSIRPSTYRDKEGFTISGTIHGKQNQSIFFKERSQAEEFVRRVKAGEESHKVLNDIWEIGSQVKEPTGEYGKNYEPYGGVTPPGHFNVLQRLGFLNIGAGGFASEWLEPTTGTKVKVNKNGNFVIKRRNGSYDAGVKAPQLAKFLEREASSVVKEPSGEYGVKGHTEVEYQKYLGSLKEDEKELSLEQWKLRLALESVQEEAGAYQSKKKGKWVHDYIPGLEHDTLASIKSKYPHHRFERSGNKLTVYKHRRDFSGEETWGRTATYTFVAPEPKEVREEAGEYEDVYDKPRPEPIEEDTDDSGVSAPVREREKERYSALEREKIKEEGYEPPEFKIPEDRGSLFKVRYMKGGKNRSITFRADNAQEAEQRVKDRYSADKIKSVKREFDTANIVAHAMKESKREQRKLYVTPGTLNKWARNNKIKGK